MSTGRSKYLFEDVFPSAAKAGRFGPKLKFVRCESNNGETGDQFASSVVFITAVMSADSDSADNTEINFTLVLKFLPENAVMRSVMNSAVQFHNEIVMYTEILPFLNFNNIVESLFPTYYWGNNSSEDGKEPIVVIEDLKNKNFVLSKHRLFLDFNHIVLALQALGKFHALSYIMKQQKPEEFNKLKNRLREHVWDREDDSMSLKLMIGPTALKGVQNLRNIQDSEVLEKLTKKLESNPVELMKYFVKPEEPLAVICHGDFCNHNMLVSYDEDSPDTPTAVKFIDLQTSRYSSPVVDLAMLLLLNTDHELRSSHWNDFISIYYNSVKETVTAAGCIPPTFDQLQCELRKKLFYGYFHCSYFLPVVLNDVPPSLDAILSLEPKEAAQQLLALGGDKAVEAILSILNHLIKVKSLAFLD